MSRPKDITIKVSAHGEDHILTTFEGEYRDLMALIYDKLFLEDFGECRGVGRCGTCHITVLNAEYDLFSYEGKELSTLSKLENRQKNSHLACQIMINKEIHGLHVCIV